MVYDVIIIGAGPAGLTAAIYAKRAGLNFLLLKDEYSVGSQICSTYEVCNFPGFNNISGQGLYDNFVKHVRELSIEIKNEKVLDLIDFDKEIKKVKTKDNVYDTKNIILATGGSSKKAGFLFEDDFVGRGISYCATCDGAFYKDKEVAVIGGGDVAVEDAIYLSRIAKKVYVLVRGDKFRAANILVKELESYDNVEIYYETLVDKIIEGDKFTGVYIKAKDSKIISELNVDGLFVGIGMEPETKLLEGKVKMENGYIIADETCLTSVNGIYVAGDIRKKSLRQVITACADGANAITSISKNLK